MRIWLRSLLAALFAIGFASIALADKRVALIVANGDYRGAALANPIVDADLVAASLRGIGFTVKVLKNADLGTFDAGVTGFADDAQGAEVALFYFAGHGFTVNEGVRPVSMLMSTSAEVTSNSDRVLRSGGIALDEIVGALIGKAQATLVFVDACRNDPRVSRAVGGQARGFAPLGPIRGGSVFIGLSTRLGSVARDGEPRHGQPVRARLRRQHSNEGHADRRRVPNAAGRGQVGDTRRPTSGHRSRRSAERRHHARRRAARTAGAGGSRRRGFAAGARRRPDVRQARRSRANLGDPSRLERFRRSIDVHYAICRNLLRKARRTSPEADRGLREDHLVFRNLCRQGRGDASRARGEAGGFGLSRHQRARCADGPAQDCRRRLRFGRVPLQGVRARRRGMASRTGQFPRVSWPDNAKQRDDCLVGLRERDQEHDFIGSEVGLGSKRSNPHRGRGRPRASARDRRNGLGRPAASDDRHPAIARWRRLDERAGKPRRPGCDDGRRYQSRQPLEQRQRTTFNAGARFDFGKFYLDNIKHLAIVLIFNWRAQHLSLFNRIK